MRKGGVMFETVGEFVKHFRESMEDQAGDILETSIIRYLNMANSRLAREPKIDQLYKYHDTFELSRTHDDGSPSAVWTISGLTEGEGCPAIGQIIDIESMLILKTKDCKVQPVKMCYVPFSEFRKMYPFPEANKPGDPTSFTFEQIQGKTKLIFNRPICKPYAIDIVYTAFHPRITSTDDILRVPVDYEDLLIEYVKNLYFEGSSDFATSAAVKEQIDYLTAQIREHLSRNKTILPLRVVGRSY